MIKLFKTIVRIIIKRLGYKLERISPLNGQELPQNEVTFKNFTSLSNCYESFLNKKNKLIEKNQLRPFLMARLTGTLSSEAYSIIESISKTKQIEGSVCEFGVGSGETSVLIANEILASEKNLHLFDSFEGLPKPSKEDRLINDIFKLGDINSYEGLMSSPKNIVLKKMKEIYFPKSRLIVHGGWFKEILNENYNLPKKVSFAYVDFDFYEPIKLALEFLDKVTTIGSIIIVDDYNYFSAGSKLAVDEFLNDNPAYKFHIPEEQIGHFIIIDRLK